MVQVPARAGVQHLGDLADDGAGLGRAQAGGRQHGQRLPHGGLGDDEGRVALLDVVHALHPAVLHQYGACGGLQDLTAVRRDVGQGQDRDGPVQDRVLATVTQDARKRGRQGRHESVAAGADWRAVTHGVPSCAQ